MQNISALFFLKETFFSDYRINVYICKSSDSEGMGGMQVQLPWISGNPERAPLLTVSTLFFQNFSEKISMLPFGLKDFFKYLKRWFCSVVLVVF